MIALNEMVQWRKLITPLIVPLFFWGAAISTAICGVFGILSGIFLLPESPFLGIMVIALTVAVACVAIATVRVVGWWLNSSCYRFARTITSTEYASWSKQLSKHSRKIPTSR